VARSRFRIYGKKRGHRSTGSGVLGWVGEAVFFSGVLALGLVGLALLVFLYVVPQWRASHEFLETRCRVLDKRVAARVAGDELSYRPEVLIEYEVGGRTYRIWTYDIWRFRPRGGYLADREFAERAIARFSPSHPVRGPFYPCWYDPADPGVAVLARGMSWWFWLVFAVPLVFVAFGGGGLAYTLSTWGKSAERRAARSGKSFEDTLRRRGRPVVEYPHVPSGDHIMDSPGTRLAFRLPASTQWVWGMGVSLTACLVWNGLVAVLLALAIRGHLRGQHDWVLTALIVPFLWIGVGLAVYFVRQFVLVTGIGPTLLEISEQPLRPGGRYRLFVSQIGRLRLKSLEIYLRCEEETRYQQGTNTRTETRCVYQERVFQHAQFEVRRGLPFEAECELVIPSEAMHSFQADHNEVKWKLVVKGSAEGWPDYERSFPIVVYPDGRRLG